jgi:subtilisin family serine protease
VVPSDTFFLGIGPDPLPEEYQWGLQTLDLPAAWGYSRGHAYVGIADFGIQISHPDLQQNFRSQLSFDVGENDDVVEEKYPDITITIQDGIEAPLGGHGTHVAGIIAATPNNGIGAAGVCWNCSLMIGKFTKSGPDPDNPDKNILIRDFTTLADTINWLVRSGAQVVNVSSGGSGGGYGYPDYPIELKNAISFADSMDVVVVASAGNQDSGESKWELDYPARDSRVISAGAVDIDETVPSWSHCDSHQELDVAAPGVNIVSTFNEGMVHNTGAPNVMGYSYYCADEVDNYLNDEHLGYGLCNGTSMAAPHVTGIAALLRSVNPLLNKEAIRSLINDYASNGIQGWWSPPSGYGVPNALYSVKAALGTSDGETLVNRLTPLFELYSSTGQDYLFTSSPQAASSALYQTLPPQPLAGHVSWNSTNGVGGAVPGYEHFPGVDYAWIFDMPKASFYVFTTHRNPFNESRELVPLYRLSYKGPTSSNAYNVDHAYATRQSEVAAATNEAVGYHLDGIEGYIFSADYAQPTGTVPLYSRYNPTRDDHVIVPGPYLSQMTSRGYTVADPTDILGYVYLNKDSDGDTLIDGFEMIAGTNAIVRDTDGDGRSDGIEINRYPYSDPLVP